MSEDKDKCASGVVSVGGGGRGIMNLGYQGNLLYLPIKKKWFDMIVSGEKREEYRVANKYWRNRIKNWMSRSGRHLYVLLRNGYGSAAPTLMCEVDSVFCRYADTGDLAWECGAVWTPQMRPDWGWEDDLEHDYFVLSLKDIRK